MTHHRGLRFNRTGSRECSAMPGSLLSRWRMAQMRTLGRRACSALVVTGAVAFLAGWFTTARAQVALSVQQAAQFIQQTGQELVAVVNGHASPTERQQQLQPLIDRTVDVDGVGRFVLGRFWRSATAQQRQDYLQMFHHVLLNSVTDKLGAYQGVRFSVDRAVQSGEQVQVWTTVIRPDNPPNQVIWVVEAIGNMPRIVDVIAEGTSLRLTQRDDYSSFLVRNNDDIDALIKALRRQVAQS